MCIDPGKQQEMEITAECCGVSLPEAADTKAQGWDGRRENPRGVTQLLGQLVTCVSEYPPHLGMPTLIQVGQLI